jgi:hypothetical protein
MPRYPCNPPSVTPLVRAVSVAEVVAYLGALVAYAMLAAPSCREEARWHHAVFFALAAAFPVCANAIHGDGARDAGLRLDNLGSSARLVGLATLCMAAAVAATGWFSDGFHWKSWTRFLELSGIYLLWGFAQQYLLQSFALRRLRQAGLPPAIAVVAAAGMFGLLHAPNWPLVLAATAAAVVWCAIFLRQPNILALGLAHGLLAVLLYHALPFEWMQGLTIGRAFLVRTGFAP